MMLAGMRRLALVAGAVLVAVVLFVLVVHTPPVRRMVPDEPSGIFRHAVG